MKNMNAVFEFDKEFDFSDGIKSVNVNEGVVEIRSKKRYLIVPISKVVFIELYE